jgi:ubiquinone/menaquinone biosynthesis C-methylase UbiE
MFHHLEEQNREKTLREVLRVLKDGGSFHLLDFAGDDRHHGSHALLSRLIHPRDRQKANSDEHMLQLMRRAGFTNAEKVKERKMLLGMLHIEYYRASV